MGCVASKLEEEEVVAICRERKHQLKLAVERRYALAEAHGKYSQSLYAVAAAIKLFVARHSSPSSSFLITFPPPCPSTPPTEDHHQNVINNPMFLQQTPTKSNHEAIACESCGDCSTTSSDSSEEEEEEVAKEEVVMEEQPCKYFYMQMPPPMPSPQRDFGWDFFNPFDGVRPEVMGGYRRISDDEIRAVREQEGIPELEEEGGREEEGKKPAKVEEDVHVHVHVHKELEKSEVGPVNVAANGAAAVSQGEPKGLTVESPEKGRELLEALKDIEDYFIRAYDSGKEVSRMLEASRVHFLSNLEEIKGVYRSSPMFLLTFKKKNIGFFLLQCGTSCFLGFHFKHA